MNLPFLNMNFKKCLVVTFALLAITGCKQEASAEEDLITRGTWRYKMTVTVETPEGIKSGSAVREVWNSTSKIKLNLPQAVNPAKIKGEAVVVDLGERGKLFALLSGYKLHEGHSTQVLYHYFGGGTNAEGIKHMANLKDAKATLEPPYYPLLVTFTDLNDPKTVKPVLEMKKAEKHPFEFEITGDHFEELFGKSVKLKDITIEMTEEPVTNTTGQYIPSFAKETGFWEWRRTLPFDDPRKIGTSDFIRNQKND